MWIRKFKLPEIATIDISDLSKDQITLILKTEFNMLMQMEPDYNPDFEYLISFVKNGGRKLTDKRINMILEALREHYDLISMSKKKEEPKFIHHLDQINKLINYFQKKKRELIKNREKKMKEISIDLWNLILNKDKIGIIFDKGKASPDSIELELYKEYPDFTDNDWQIIANEIQEQYDIMQENIHYVTK